jgi:hypothetical protein
MISFSFFDFASLFLCPFGPVLRPSSLFLSPFIQATWRAAQAQGHMLCEVLGTRLIWINKADGQQR